MNRQNRQKTRRLWTGDATELDRLNAGRDPRQTHFFFYEELDGSASPNVAENLQHGQRNESVAPDPRIGQGRSLIARNADWKTLLTSIFRGVAEKVLLVEGEGLSVSCS